MRIGIGMALAVVAFATLAHAEDMNPEAKAHLDKGLALYEKADYAGAIREFEQGYAIDPRPELVYAQAQAERLGGKCESAVQHYEAFLATRPEPEREAAARANLARCKDELAKNAPPPEPTPTPTPAPAPTAAPAPAPAPAPPPVVFVPQPTPTPVRQRRHESPPFYADVLGDVLTGSGIVALGVGTAFYLSSVSNENKAKNDGDVASGGTYQAHVDRIDRAGRQRTTAVIAGAAGLALVTGGVLRYVLHTPAGDEQNVGAWVAPRAAGLAWGRTF